MEAKEWVVKDLQKALRELTGVVSGTGYGIRLDGGSSNGSIIGNTIDNSVVNSGTAIGVGIYFQNGSLPTFGGTVGLANTIQNNITGVLLSCGSAALPTGVGNGNNIYPTSSNGTDVTTEAC